MDGFPGPLRLGLFQVVYTTGTPSTDSNCDSSKVIFENPSAQLSELERTVSESLRSCRDLRTRSDTLVTVRRQHLGVDAESPVT